jgi:hypothetical protein
LKLRVLIAPFSLLVSLTSSQYLETLVRMPPASRTIDLCYNPTNNMVYAANEYTNNVVVINGATNVPADTIALDGMRLGIQVRMPEARTEFRRGVNLLLTRVLNRVPNCDLSRLFRPAFRFGLNAVVS